jgi:DNA-binding protein YbaB
MTAVGGSIESVSIGGRIMAVSADNEAQLNLGGKNVEVQMNGNGTPRYIIMRTAWSIEGLQIVNDHAEATHEFLQGVADTVEEKPIVIRYADGVAYNGNGLVAGEVKGSSQSATVEVTLSGGGKMEQQ